MCDASVSHGIRIANTGSANLSMSWRITDLPADFAFTVSVKNEKTGRYEITWLSGQYFVILRGTGIDVSLTLTDLGANSGYYNFDLSFYTAP
jgi:hypothetical protein